MKLKCWNLPMVAVRTEKSFQDLVEEMWRNDEESGKKIEREEGVAAEAETDVEIEIEAEIGTEDVEATAEIETDTVTDTGEAEAETIAGIMGTKGIFRVANFPDIFHFKKLKMI